MHGHPDDVVVTTGSQQALDLVTQIFVDPGDVIVAEAPSYGLPGVAFDRAAKGSKAYVEFARELVRRGVPA